VSRTHITHCIVYEEKKRKEKRGDRVVDDSTTEHSTIKCNTIQQCVAVEDCTE
jgi:hypothetical protein